MRTKNTLRNLLTAWAGQAIVLLCNFVSRAIFIKILPVEYLGISGLFNNVLSVLSLADLGISFSIAFYLYEPIANGDEHKISQIMNFFKKVYTVIGFVVLGVGLALTPFLGWFISGESTIPNLSLIYILYVINSAVSYFNTYKVILIGADQKNYLVQNLRYLTKILQIVVGIVILYITKNYIAYYSVQIFSTIVFNFGISYKANKLYPYLKENSKEKVSEEYKTLIGKNTVAMLYHKIGAVVVNGTDNILISKFINIVAVGLYSNYTLLLVNLTSVLDHIFSAMTASIGNFNATESKTKQESLFHTIFLLDFAVYNFCTISLFVLFNPFIKMWLGEEFLMGQEVVLVIVLNFFLQGMRKTVLIFKEAYGLFRQDRYKPLLEAMINLVASLVLLNKFGIIGVFIGTTISSVTTYLWVEPVVVFKYGIGSGMKRYFKRYVQYFIETIICCGLAYGICNLLPEGLLYFLVRMVVCVTVFAIDFAVFHIRSREFRDLLSKVRNR